MSEAQYEFEKELVRRLQKALDERDADEVYRFVSELTALKAGV